MRYDVVIIGGGIVGVSTAWQLMQRYPRKKILLLEKEAQVAQHQTGHNSGVIHAGVYYQPGSLKANFCREGVAATIRFCQENNIPFEQCGKLLVATNDKELQRMGALFERCKENGIEAQWLAQGELKKREPNIAGTGAIYVRSTGIVDYRLVTAKMAEHFVALGGEIQLGTEVTGLREEPLGVTVESSRVNIEAELLLSCAGLMADRVTRMLGIPTNFRIIPFRGEYYQLPRNKNKLIEHLIYPIPDPDLPFLGVHLTRMIDGSITVGPNAVLGWKREGYGTVNVSYRDVLSMFCFPGFWRLVGANLKSGLTEIKNSWWKRGYLKQVRKYCPQLELADLKPYPAGVRAQAVLEDGSLVHDFLFAESSRSLHVCNAPSPAATSAIPIGGYICDRIAEKLA